MLAVGGVADGDGSRQADLKGLQTPECLRFLIEREEIGIRGRANRRPTSAPTVYVKARCGRRVDNNRYSVMVPASRLVNVDVRENIPDLVCFCWTVGWWEVFSRVARI